MKAESTVELVQELGADRVLDPVGALPQRAERLAATGPVRPHEFEIAAERLCLDSTSHRDIHSRADGDPGRMAELIAETVAARGKMHNPETDSGGILVGTVTAVGESYGSPPTVGDRVATLGSLTLTPLRLDAVTRVDPASPQVEVEGTAYVFDRAAWGAVPDDLPLEAALAVYDVCSAASHTRELASADGVTLVLGAGHAGKLALAAARDVMRDGTLAAVDVDAGAIERVAELGLCDVAVAADLRDPIASLEAVRAAGVPAADLTVVVVNAPDCEPTALLLTADGGTVLFFSMATSFSAAALAVDGIGSDARMVIGGGRAPDGGAYALGLVRGSAPLREALGVGTGEAG